MKKRIGIIPGSGVLAWPVLFWTAAFAVPLLLVVFRGVGESSQLLSPIRSPYYRRIFGFTLFQAGLSTICSVLFGLPGAYLTGRRRFPGRRFLKSLATVPFVLPSILAVLGFILVFGNAGLLNSLKSVLTGGRSEPWKILYSLKAIIMAHVFYNFPITLRIVGDAWAALPQSTHRAARVLGAGRFRTFFTVELPGLTPAILTSATVTFLYCFLSFAIILVLGGSPDLSTLEVEVYRLVRYQLDFSSGSVLALMESVAALGILFLYARLEGVLRSRSGPELGSGPPRPPAALTGKASIPALLYLIPALLLILAPLVSVVLHSFVVRATRIAPVHLSLDHWKRLFGTGRVSGTVPLLSVIRTILLGVTVAVTTTFTASMAGWYTARQRGWIVRLLDSMMFIPMGVSSVILGLGYLLLAHRIPGSQIIRLAFLVGAHTMVALPFAYRIISGRLKEISPRIPLAARSAGAGPIRTLFSIELPLVRSALVSAGVFSLALSAGELNATVILAPGNFTTIPLAMYRMIGAYDIFGACALGTLLIGISAVGFFALDRYGEDRL